MGGFWYHGPMAYGSSLPQARQRYVSKPKKVSKKQAARLVARRLRERKQLKNSSKAGRKRNMVPDIA